MARTSMSILPMAAVLVVVNIVAIAVFMAGFLLTRMELPKFSTCSEPPASQAFMRNFADKYDFSSHFRLILDKWEQAGMPFLEGTQTSSGCWASRRFGKAVVVIVDAMRFDFAHNDEQEPESKTNTNYKNRLQLFERRQKAQPEHCKLFQFEADPPTTTMQRLKGLVTGGMPTFIDFSSNFDSSAITEDNILLQLNQAGMDVVMMGDDTWLNLFPDAFRRAFPYPSFNVKDLHTVDDGVIAHLRPEIDAGKFDLLIAHFLGVDHVGHRFHANHPTMKDKLIQLDRVLDDLLSAIDDDTIVFVLGDHGMTPEGNHGGTTSQETNTALFAYSKQKLFAPGGAPHDHPAIKQVDLVPTLSLLLGASIPYSSLGTVMTDLFTSRGTSPWQDACAALRINAWQVQRYLHDYSATSQIFESELMQHLTADFLSVDHDFIQLALERQSEPFNAEPLYSNLAKRYVKVLSRSQAMCREKWTMFDGTYMAYGIMSLLMGVIGLFLYIGLEPVVQWRSLVSCLALSVIGLAPGIYMVSGVSAIVAMSIAASAGALINVLIAVVRSPRRHWTVPHPTVVLALAVVVPYFGGLLSNSVVITESYAMRYVTVTFSLLLGLFDLRFATCNAAGIALTTCLSCICLRLMGEGQSFGPGALLTDEFFSYWQLLQTFGSLLLLSAAGYWYSAPIRNASIRSGFRVWLLICSSITSVYWILEATATNHDHQTWSFLPQMVYGASCLLAFLTFVSRSGIDRQQSLMVLMATFAAPYLLLLGPRSPFVVLLTLAVIYLRSYRRRWLNVYVHSDIPECVFFWLLGLHLYFVTGHSNTFSSLQVSAAFVGFEKFNFHRSGCLLLINTFGGYILSGWGLAIISRDYTLEQLAPLHKSDDRGHGYAFDRPMLGLITLHVCRAGISTLSVLLHKRHLMVWDVFAPKFVFDTASFTAVACIMFYLAFVNKIF